MLIWQFGGAGSYRSGVEWRGVEEWSGVEWSGVESQNSGVQPRAVQILREFCPILPQNSEVKPRAGQILGEFCPFRKMIRPVPEND